MRSVTVHVSAEPMWTCYVTFCLDRFKRKTNVTELKEKVPCW